MSIEWINQYLRLRRAHEIFPYEPESDNERWGYVELAGTDIKNPQKGEKWYAQLAHVFQKGLYKTDKLKLAELQEMVDSIFDEFKKFCPDAPIDETLEAVVLAEELELPWLLKKSEAALEKKLKKMTIDEKEMFFSRHLGLNFSDYKK